MAYLKALVISIFFLCFTTHIVCKIVLPHKLRYLENMLNSEVIAKAAKIRQRLDSNPAGVPDNDKSWPTLLAKYGQDEKKNLPTGYNNFNNVYARRMPNFK